MRIKTGKYITLFFVLLFWVNTAFTQDSILGIPELVGEKVETASILSLNKAKETTSSLAAAFDELSGKDKESSFLKKGNFRTFRLRNNYIVVITFDASNLIVEKVLIGQEGSAFSTKEFGLPNVIRTNEKIDYSPHGKPLAVVKSCGNIAQTNYCFIEITSKIENRTNETVKNAETKVNIITSDSQFKAILTLQLKLEAIKVAQITSDSGTYFKQGLINLQDQRNSQARDDFDKAIEVFLLSDVNVNDNEKLLRCYSEMVETIYRMEIPAEKTTPQLRRLSTTCGWGIDTQLLDSVAKPSQPKPNDTTGDSSDTALVKAVIGKYDGKNDVAQIGFVEQNFEPAIGDVLSQIELEQDTRAIPVSGKSPYKQRPTKKASIPKNTLSNLDIKPKQLPNGRVPLVMEWFQENLHDPYSMKIVRWGKFDKIYSLEVSFWSISVKLRAKNLYGAYVLNEYTFFIRQNKIWKYTKD